MTVIQIESDGLDLAERSDEILEADAPTAMTTSFDSVCTGYADALVRLRPDALAALGEPYEAFVTAVVIAVRTGVVPAHVGRGQLSDGLIDSHMLLAISNLAQIHFTMDSTANDRLWVMVQEDSGMAEVGMIGPDATRELEPALALSIFAVTYHPATGDVVGSRMGLEGILEPLGGLPDAAVIITAPNVDSGGWEITDRLQEYVAGREGTMQAPSLGRRLYLSLLMPANVVIGNPSIGINKAPALGTPSVNIGRRQDGRTEPPSVIDSDESSGSIRAAISRCLLAIPQSDVLGLKPAIDKPAEWSRSRSKSISMSYSVSDGNGATFHGSNACASRQARTGRTVRRLAGQCLCRIRVPGGDQ